MTAARERVRLSGGGTVRGRPGFAQAGDGEGSAVGSAEQEGLFAARELLVE
jgi:hypothetical protein